MNEDNIAKNVLKIYYYIVPEEPTEAHRLTQIMTLGVKSLEDLEDTHIIVYEDVLDDTHMIVYEDVLDDNDIEHLSLNVGECLNELFNEFNDNIINPLLKQEKQIFIKENMTHTSMSVGDVVEFIIDGKSQFWALQLIGWVKL